MKLGGAKPWSANRELGTFHLQSSGVSVHSLHFMVCAPLKIVEKKGNIDSSYFAARGGWGSKTIPQISTYSNGAVQTRVRLELADEFVSEP